MMNKAEVFKFLMEWLKIQHPAKHRQYYYLKDKDKKREFAITLLKYYLTLYPDFIYVCPVELQIEMGVRLLPFEEDDEKIKSLPGEILGVHKITKGEGK